MSYWFQLGKDGVFTTFSYERGLDVEGMDSQIVCPAKRYTRRNVLGLDGYLLTGGGELETITRNVNVFGQNHTASTSNYIMNWLRGNNCVIFSDDSTHYRKYDLFEAMQATSEIDGKGYELTIPFTCTPYRYWVSPTTVRVNAAEGAAGKTVINAGTAANLPLIRVGRINEGGGSGWVQFGTGTDNRVEFSELRYPLYIDSELREVYYENLSDGNANAITTLSKFPSWTGNNGSKTITFGGNVLKLDIQMRERDTN